MKINLVGMMALVGAAMAAVEAVQTAGKGLTGEEKLNAVLETVGKQLPSLVPTLEGAVGKDLVNDAVLKEAFSEAVSAIKHVVNVIEAVPELKPKPAV